MLKLENLIQNEIIMPSANYDEGILLNDSEISLRIGNKKFQ